MDKNIYDKIIEGFNIKINMERATTNDIVIAKLEFTNKTDNTIFDSNFKVYSSDKLISLENNLYVNGEVSRLNPNKEIEIPTIYPGEVIKIIYKWRVKEIKEDSMDNIIFILSDSKNAVLNISKSCSVYFFRYLESFNNITIEHKISIPDLQDELKEVISVMVDPIILKQYVVETLQGISLENNIYTGYKLMIRLQLSETIEYIINDEMETAKWMVEKHNVSTYIMLPEDNVQGQFVEAVVEVNKILYKIIDKKEILLTINLNMEIMAN